MSETRTNVEQAVVGEIAINLKRHYRAFAGGDDAVRPEDDSAFIDMSRDLVNTGQFTLADGRSIDLETAKEKLNEFKGLDPKVKKLLGNVDILDQIPEKHHVDAIAGAIDRGVKKSTFSFKDFNFSGLFSMIGNFIAGAMDWMTKGGSFWEHVGKHSADSTTQAVRSELDTLRSESPGLGQILNKQRVSEIVDQVRQETMYRATKDEKYKSSDVGVDLGSVQMLEHKDLSLNKVRDLIDFGIIEQVDNRFATRDNPDTQEVEGDLRYALQNPGWVNSRLGGALNDDQVREVQNLLASTMQEIVHDEKTASLDNEAIRKKIAAGVTGGVDWTNAWENSFQERIIAGDDGESDISDKLVDKIKSLSTLYAQGVDITESPSTQSMAAHPASGPQGGRSNL